MSVSSKYTSGVEKEFKILRHAFRSPNHMGKYLNRATSATSSILSVLWVVTLWRGWGRFEFLEYGPIWQHFGSKRAPVNPSHFTRKLGSTIENLQARFKSGSIIPQEIIEAMQAVAKGTNDFRIVVQNLKPKPEAEFTMNSPAVRERRRALSQFHRWIREYWAPAMVDWNRWNKETTNSGRGHD